MKKILNFILVNRKETQNKWWHRLFIVLLLASTAMVLLMTFSVRFDGSSPEWSTYKPIAFSLEPNYQAAKGSEVSCKNLLDTSTAINDRHYFAIHCDGVSISASDAERYENLFDEKNKNLIDQFGLNKYHDINCPNSSLGAKLDCSIRLNESEKLDPAYPQYVEAWKNLASSMHVKVVRDYDTGRIIKDIFIFLLVPILWIIFWSSVVYRSILYVIFGAKK